MPQTQSTFKMPNRNSGSKSKQQVNQNLPAQMGLGAGGSMKPSIGSLLSLKCLPGDRRVTRGSMKAWQDGHGEPWSDLPGLRLKFMESCTTSDYGTASEGSIYCSSASGFSPPPPEPCKSKNTSSACHVSYSDDEGIDETCDLTEPFAPPLSDCKWNSDSESDDGTSDWNETDFTFTVLLHPVEQITAVIPLRRDRKEPLDMKIRVLKDEMYRPKCGMKVHQVSPVISVEPHGIEFSIVPAYISIPVTTTDEQNLVCLCSNTHEHVSPCWERLPKDQFQHRDGFLVLRVSHFSLFTVLLEEPRPTTVKRIRRRVGGTLKVEEVPGVEVTFPRGCLEEDVEASLRVYDCEPAGLKSDLPSSLALASPILVIDPHGHQFDPQRPGVVLTLPVPDLRQICAKFRIPIEQVSSRLAVYQSPTRETEPLGWQRLQCAPVVNLNHSSGVPVVSFEVHHFSFFTVMWDLLSTSLYEAKMGMAYFYPYITFSMMCEAFMQETPNTNRFGLEVICYRSDRRLPELANLQHRVGSSIKPKLVRPGRLLVRLRSQMFDADEEAGEETEMSKEENDFRGRDFEKQYACKFKKGVKMDLGAFGKVLVEKIKGSGGRNDPVFEFNLYKTGHETEATLPERSERWTIVAIRELAANLQITDDNNWKKFAQHIGFTRREIKSKLELAGDPFMAMMTLYNQRGGTPEEFVQSLFAVSREIRLNLGKNTPPSTSSNGSVSPSHSGSGSQHISPARGRNLWGGFWGRKKDQAEQDNNTTDTDMPAPPAKRKAKKRSHPSSGKNSSGKASERPPAAKRHQFSDVSETATHSSSGEAGDEDSDEGAAKEAGKDTVDTAAKESKDKDTTSTHSSDIHRQNPRMLSDRDIWKVSFHMENISWRALGRTLGIEESVLINVEHSYRGCGTREHIYQMLLQWKGYKPRKCTLGMLYSALCNEKFNAVATSVIETELDEDL